MQAPAENEIRQVLSDLSAGRKEAASRLLSLVYDDLRALARHRLAKEPPGLTLQATALVHEAYLRLMRNANNWENCGHFFAAAAEAMRRILVERSRKYRGPTRGGGRSRLPLEEDELPAGMPNEDLLALDEALSRLETVDKIRSDVVKLRFFAGLTIDQTAEILGISPATVSRHWNFAKAWLYDAVSCGEDLNSPKN